MDKVIVSDLTTSLYIAPYATVCIQELPDITALHLEITVDTAAAVEYHCTAPSVDSSVRSITFILIGELATVTCTGSFLLNNDAVYQVAINQIHKAPKTCSSVVLKMVVKDRAHCAYKGRIFIDEQGSKTEASQHHKALVLSPKASVTSEPTLEVLTHDVVCNHGSAIAYLNQEHLEYLMSRGISDQHAERLIVDSFLSGE